MSHAIIICTWANAKAKYIESWVQGNPQAQIEQRGARDNTLHRLNPIVSRKLDAGKLARPDLTGATS